MRKLFIARTSVGGFIYSRLPIKQDKKGFVNFMRQPLGAACSYLTPSALPLTLEPNQGAIVVFSAKPRRGHTPIEVRGCRAGVATAIDAPISHLESRSKYDTEVGRVTTTTLYYRILKTERATLPVTA